MSTTSHPDHRRRARTLEAAGARASTAGSEPTRVRRRRGPWWSLVTVVELGAAVTAVVLDLLLPALVILAVASCSLLARRESVRTLGPVRWPRGARQAWLVAALAVGWTVLQLVLWIPLAEHVAGEPRDLSQFAELEGDVAMLVTLVALSWALAAVGEELAFRGFVLTRLTDLTGNSAVARVVSVTAVAVLFAFLHTEQGTAGMLLTFVDALWFGALRYAFGTLWAAVVAHGVGNTVGLATYFVLGPVAALW